MPHTTTTKEALRRERLRLLNRVQHLLEMPMIILGFIWLVLLVVELLWGLNPLLEIINFSIWGLFILDFLLKFFLAPDKSDFLKKNVLTAISLVVPALRIFRIARFVRIMRSVRAVRGIRFIKVIGSINRGMRSLSASLGRRKFGYVLSFTLVVLLIGAAGMYAFENQEKTGFNTYGESLWWTAMLLTSMGSEFWPRTPEGRALCFLLSVYGFAVFGYFTASLASFFMGSDAENEKAELAGARQINHLTQEINLLRNELATLLKATNASENNFNNSTQDRADDSRET